MSKVFRNVKGYHEGFKFIISYHCLRATHSPFTNCDASLRDTCRIGKVMSATVRSRSNGHESC